MGAGGNGNNRLEWEGNGNKTRLNLGSGMGMNHWEWERMGFKKTFPHTSAADVSERNLSCSVSYITRRQRMKTFPDLNLDNSLDVVDCFDGFSYKGGDSR